MVEAGYDAASFAYRADDEPDGEYGAWLADGDRRGCPRGRPCWTWAVAAAFPVRGGWRRTGARSPAWTSRPCRSSGRGGSFPGRDSCCADMSDVRFDAGVVRRGGRALLPDPRARRRAAGSARVDPHLAPAGREAPGDRRRRRVDGDEGDWLGSGAPMWWSHEDTATYLRWLDGGGVPRCAWSRFVPKRDVPAADDAGHTLILATVPSLRADRSRSARARDARAPWPRPTRSARSPSAGRRRPARRRRSSGGRRRRRPRGRRRWRGRSGPTAGAAAHEVPPPTGPRSKRVSVYATAASEARITTVHCDANSRSAHPDTLWPATATASGSAAFELPSAVATECAKLARPARWTTPSTSSAAPSAMPAPPTPVATADGGARARRGRRAPSGPRPRPPRCCP